MKLSIIIPMYNCEKTIKETINSIIKQYRGTSIEVIVVDDGSLDNSYNTVNDCFSNIDFVRLLRKKNGGPSSARHYGAQHSKGEYLWFIDAGDKIIDGCLCEILAQLEKKECDILVFDYLEMNGNNKLYRKQKNIDNDLTKSLLLNGVVPGMWTKIFKRNSKVISRFTEIEKIWIGEDLCFSIMASLESKNVLFIQKPYYIYIRDENSLTMKTNNPKDITVLDSIKQIKHSLETKGVFDHYKEEFEFMCFNRTLINHVLLSENSIFFKDFINFYNKQGFLLKNRYLKYGLLLKYITMIKAKLPFQNLISRIIRTITHIKDVVCTAL